jgi:hypothetical protein
MVTRVTLKRLTVYDVLRNAGVNADHLNMWDGSIISPKIMLFSNDGELMHAVTHSQIFY